MVWIAIKIQYIGTNYAGYQIQPNAITVQEKLELALFKVLNQKINTVSSGRTDTGVHANGQVISFQIENYPQKDEKRFSFALNHFLPKDIRVVRSVYLDFPFHARFDATFRQYKYRLLVKEDVFENKFAYRPIFEFDINKLIDSAELFKRYQDYTTFSKFNPDQNNPVCNVNFSEWVQKTDNLYEYTIQANHFLYGMVRSVVGAMLDISRDKRSRDNIDSDFQAMDRRLNSALVPSKGLILDKIIYKDNFFV